MFHNVLNKYLMKYESANLLVAPSAYRYYDEHEFTLIVFTLNWDICQHNFCCGEVSDDFWGQLFQFLVEVTSRKRHK